MSFLSPDSKFMQGWTNLTDGIYINLLMLVTSLPIFTIGAALSAGQTTMRKMLNSEGHITKTYFRAFKENFARATLLWMIFLITGLVCAGSWLFLYMKPLLVPKIALLIVWAIGFEWVFALQARFDNTPMNTLANAYIYGVSYFWATLALIGIDVVFIGLCVASWIYLPQVIFLILVFGYGSILALHVPIQEYIFRKYIFSKMDKNPLPDTDDHDGDIADLERLEHGSQTRN